MYTEGNRTITTLTGIKRLYGYATPSGWNDRVMVSLYFIGDDIQATNQVSFSITKDNISEVRAGLRKLQSDLNKLEASL